MSKNKRLRRRHGKRGRGWLYTGVTLGLVVLAGGGFSYYEYQRLQPQNFFQHVPVIAAANALNSTADGGSGTSNSATPNNTASGAPTGIKSTVPGTFNVLLMGTDTRKGQKLGHSDSMMLIHVDMNTHKYSALSIPRDTRVLFPPYGYTKLTTVQYMDEAKYGTQAGVIDTVKYIANLTGIPINYYAETDYWGLQDIVDAVGGINMDLPFNVTLTHPWYPQDGGMTFTKGVHFVNGRLTTEIVHERYSVPGIDYGRQQLQEEALLGIAKELEKPQNYSEIPGVIKALPNYLVATNMTTSDMMSFLLGVRGDFHPDSQIQYHQIRGKGEVIYNDVLKARDDEVVLQPGQLQTAAQEYLRG